MKTYKKVLLIDSADRDTVNYPLHGDFTIFLPRVYENVVSLRLVQATFPPLTAASGVEAYYTSPTAINRRGMTVSGTTVPTTTNYFVIEIDGFNKVDETAINSVKSTFTDSFFALIPTTTQTYADQSFILFNNRTNYDPVSEFKPPLGKVDRLRVRTRLHSQQGETGFLFWGSNSTTVSTAEFSLLLEIECIDKTCEVFNVL